ncbi:MAG: NUDIX hydrolase [Beijerinckiaceae bacterium]
MTGTPRPVLAVSLAVFRDGKILLATRTRAPMKDVWSLPGGKVEPGETLEEAAIREMQEETGVTATVMAFNRHVEVIRRNEDGSIAHHFVIASFVGQWVAGEARTGPEAGAVMWADPFDLQVPLMTPDLVSVVRRAAVLAAKAAMPDNDLPDGATPGLLSR